MSYLDSQQQAATKVQLDWSATTDVANNLALTQNGWTDIGSNQTFTIDSSDSVVEISVAGGIQSSGTGADYGARIVIDSGGTPINKRIGSCFNTGQNILAGSSPVELTGLSA